MDTRCGQEAVRRAIAPLPVLSELEVERIERLMARGDLPRRQDDGPGATRMLGVVAFAGLAMVAGGAYTLWTLIAPVTAGP